MAKKIKKEFKSKICTDDDLCILLAKANRGYENKPTKITTILRWVRNNSERLTTISNLELIAKYLGVNNIFDLVIDSNIEELETAS